VIIKDVLIQFTYIGTSSDNVKDRYNRFPNSGRGRNYSKLTSDQFEDIFRLHKLGLSHSTISKEFNVVPQTISNIVRGNTKLTRRI
jgi:DNA-binding NarL/FixJ family response regulator